MTDNRLRALVVDDDFNLCESLREFLQGQHNFLVDTALDGNTALRLIRDDERDYDVAIIDQLLESGPDGIQLMEEIRRLDSEIECVILTGWGTEYRQRALEAGAFRYIEKPFDNDELVKIIHSAARQVRLRAISHKILTIHQLEPLMDEICLAAASLLAADQAAIVLENLKPATVWYPFAKQKRLPQWLKVTLSSLTPEILQTGQVRLIHALDSTLASSRTKSMGALAAAPIPAEGGKRGVLYVYSTKSGYFHEGETVALLQALAGQAGLALDTALKFEQINKHASYMKALVKAGEELTRLDDRDDQLQVVWEFVRQQLNCDTFFIGLYDSDNRIIDFPLYYDEGRVKKVHPRKLTRNLNAAGISGFVIEHAEELSWGNETERQQEFARLGIKPKRRGKASKSGFFIPLNAGNQKIGLMSIQAYQEQAFSRIILDAFRALGSYLVVAMSNSRTLHALRSTTENLIRLNKIALEIGKPRELNELLGEILHQAVRLLEAEGGAIYLLEPDGEYLQCACATGEIIRNLRIHSNQGLSGEILKRGEALEDPNYRHRSNRLHELDDLNLTLAAGAPIRSGEQVLGTLIVHDTRQNRRAGEHRLALLQQLADHAGLAIQKTDFLGKLRSIQSAATRVSESLILEEVLQNTCREVVSLFGVEHSGAVLFDRQSSKGRVEAEFPVEYRMQGENIPVEDIPAEGPLVEKRELLIFPDIEEVRSELGVLADLWTKANIRSIAIIPIVHQDTLLGSFSLDVIGHKRYFFREEIELAKIFAAQVSVAVENARLYTRSERRKTQLNRLEQASRSIRAETETQRLLHTVVRLAVELVNGAAGCLLINQPHRDVLEVNSVYSLPEKLIRMINPVDVGLAGRVLQEGCSKFIDHFDAQEESDPIFADFSFHNAVGLPLIHAGVVDAVLMIFDANQGQALEPLDQEILDRFADQAATAYHTSHLIRREQRFLNQLVILYTISDYIQAAGKVEDVLHMMLTGITAGYGLAFNRAALFLLDERGESFHGQLGIGQTNIKDANNAWAEEQSAGRQNFQSYLTRLKNNAIPLTPIGVHIQNLVIPATPDVCNIFLDVMSDDLCRVLTVEEFSCLPEVFSKAFEPGQPLVLAPLKARGQPIGILAADNKFTQDPITAELQESLLTFTRNAAVAIANHQLYHEADQERQRLRSFLEASNALVLSDDERKVLQEVVGRARQAAGAMVVLMLLIDKDGGVRRLFTTRKDKLFDNLRQISPTDATWDVMHSGAPVILQDLSSDPQPVHPGSRIQGAHAAVSLLLNLEGQRLGVMWFYYSERRTFTRAEIHAMQLYVNQAALAYDGVQRITELVHLRQAAAALAGESESERVLKQIVDSARTVLNADSAAIWIYDDEFHTVKSEKSVHSGLAEKDWRKMRLETLRAGSLINHILSAGWVGVTDIERTDSYAFLSDVRRQSLREKGIRSFQGLALKIGEENLGILFVNHKNPREFLMDDQDMAQTFSYHAALALKKSQLIEEVKTAHSTARQVSEMTLVGDIEQTLNLLAKGIRRSLDCGAVTIFRFDPDRGQFHLPPAIAGVHYQDRVARYERVLEGSIVKEILELKNPWYVEDIALEPKFQDRRFATDERIKSVAAFPLVVGELRVGVMFVNYRTRHIFDPGERDNIQLFANQAAVAIRNDQLYLMEQHYRRTLTAIQDSSAAINALQDLKTVLDTITSKAQEIFQADAASLMLWNETKNYLSIRSAYGLDEKYQERQKISSATVDRIIREKGAGPHVFSIHDEPLGDSELIQEEGLQKVLVAPLNTERELIGVLNIYTRDEYYTYTSKDKELAAILANNMAIAIQNAQHRQEREGAYCQLEATRDQMVARTALAWMNMVSGAWRHAIEKHADTIRGQVSLLRMQNLAEVQAMQTFDERLDIIERMAEEIMRKPITPPLAAEENAVSISINELVIARLTKLWKDDPYRRTKLIKDIDMEQRCQVRADPEWLRRAFDILIDNAVEVTAVTPDGQVTISIRVVNEQVKIACLDNGPGIPDKVRPYILKKVVPKMPGEKGLGLGLLMAQMIVQTFGGELTEEKTSLPGTCMVITLPLDKEE